VFGSGTKRRAPVLPACRQCGTPSPRADATICRRCGLRYGEEPRPDAALPSCPICYRETDPDGLVESRAVPGRRLDLQAHIAEHDRFPVGDDEHLEALRRGDRIRVGRWDAPFDVVRRYLVTGILDGGRRRTMQHDALVTAMAQLSRWGSSVPLIGDQAEWAEARAALTDLMERYHRRRV
jgi:hypothetical protein